MNANKDVASIQPAQLSETLTKEIVLHMTKEIGTASNNTMTFRTRKNHNKWVAANPTRTSFANALKAYRNHRITFTGSPISMVMPAISFYDRQISLYDRQIS